MAPPVRRPGGVRVAGDELHRAEPLEQPGAALAVSSVARPAQPRAAARRPRCRRRRCSRPRRARGQVDPVDVGRHLVEQLEGQAKLRRRRRTRTSARRPGPPSIDAASARSRSPARCQCRATSPATSGARVGLPGQRLGGGPVQPRRAPPAAARRTRPPGRRGGGSRRCRRPGPRPHGRRSPRGACPRRPPRGRRRCGRAAAPTRPGRSPRRRGARRRVSRGRWSTREPRAARAAWPGAARAVALGEDELLDESGFPAERASVSSSRSGGSGWPASSATSRAASARSSRGTWIRCVRQPAELGQPRAERPRLVAGVLAVGQQDQHPLVGEVRGQERQQVEGRPVGPVHVLDDVQHRSARRSSGRAARARPGTAAAARRPRSPGLGSVTRLSVPPAARQQPRELGRPVRLLTDDAGPAGAAQRLGQGGVRQRLAGDGHAGSRQGGRRSRAP